ncbi:unnamed protein product [Orchesella dallaii]|uniref:Uncharacterized protein n=1 Tax=Orchesella dallaii TaxID=48710 RepID=A0ABP1RVH0_9HEXA
MMGCQIGIESYFLRVFVLVVQLGCGIWAASWSAFFNTKEVDIWAYVIFGIYIALGLIILFNVGIEIRIGCQLQRLSLAPNLFPLNFNLTYLLCSVATISLLFILAVYNGEIIYAGGALVSAPLIVSVTNYPSAVFAPTMLGARLFFPRKFKLVPYGIIVPWLDLGCGVAITIWTAFFNDLEVRMEAYGILVTEFAFMIGLIWYYSKKMISRLTKFPLGKITIPNSVVGGAAIGTTFCFCIVAFYNVVVLGNDELMRTSPVFKVALYLFALENLVILTITLLTQKSEVVRGGVDPGIKNVANPDHVGVDADVEIKKEKEPAPALGFAEGQDNRLQFLGKV